MIYNFGTKPHILRGGSVVDYLEVVLEWYFVLLTDSVNYISNSLCQLYNQHN